MMGVFKTVVALTVNNAKVGVKNNRNSPYRPLLSCAPVAMMSLDRGAHTKDITKNIYYISNEKVKFTADPKTLKLDNLPDKPLCVMINWLLARQKHVMKYAKLYLEQGFDVLSVSCTPWQLMWPVKGSQLIAKDLLKFMSTNVNSHPLVLHGFSVGGYIWGEVIGHSMENKELYTPVMNRIAAQVWDSAADVSEISIGVPPAVFPKNKIMQKTLKAYMEYHLRTFHDVATSHYIRSSQLYHSNPCRAPALILLSKSDPVGAERSNRIVHDGWVKLGVKCTWKCWDRSPHVQHYTYHKEEYVAALYDHLEMCNVLPQSDKARLQL
ncbi:uncharacterized protein LOC113512027 [Galleria mellonella]|uniref:Uncharacterized protein LOC113512027 n=1 Tax=Galleria mellonella TaxID=7137 RepID=A0A6J3BZR6_GALME|nr:uncharacterized protein LOC113512027 [Galleria mellonella]